MLLLILFEVFLLRPNCHSSALCFAYNNINFTSILHFIHSEKVQSSQCYGFLRCKGTTFFFFFLIYHRMVYSSTLKVPILVKVNKYIICILCNLQCYNQNVLPDFTLMHSLNEFLTDSSVAAGAFQMWGCTDATDQPQNVYSHIFLYPSDYLQCC